MLEFNLILILITFVVLFIASYTDIRTREVPDWLSYSLLFGALGVRMLASFENGFDILFSGLLGLAACFIFALLFYYSHQWGGADSKLLMSMGAVIGITFPLSLKSFHLLWYFIALLFIGAIYGLFWMIVVAVKQYQPFRKEFSFFMRQNKQVHLGILGISALALAASIKITELWPLVFLIIGSFYLLVFTISVEKGCFHRRIDIDSLTEGDWLAEDIIHKQIKLIGKKTLVKDDLDTLRRLKKENKLDEVLIKEGIPFVPSFLGAYVVIIFMDEIAPFLVNLLF